MFKFVAQRIFFMELRIKELLKAKRITQRTLAKKLDISVVGLNKMINGNPTLGTLRKIAEALNVELKDLFTVPLKDNDLFILKNGEYINIGKIDLNIVKESQNDI